MTQIRYALLSVTDKTGIVDFAKGLAELGFRILSTGGTSKLLRENQIRVIEVSEYTGHPECLDGRVKTLHPKIHGGLLADRAKSDHVSDMKRLGLEAIDVVAVNLYDFAGQAAGKNLTVSQAIEHIDVGGPTMLRAAAKNHHHVFAVIDPKDYPVVLTALKNPMGASRVKENLARKVFSMTAAYDQLIADHFAKCVQESKASGDEANALALPKELDLNLQQVQPLRYGENNHQCAGLYAASGKARRGLAAAKILQGKELSYNNLVDLDAASGIVADLDPLASMTIIKHSNPCATASLSRSDAKTLFARTLACDPKCAFGGIVASNVTIDGPCAAAMTEIFLECVIAPSYSPEALVIFQTKKNLRVIESPVVNRAGRVSEHCLRTIDGGYLVQTPDDQPLDVSQWRCASAAQPTGEMLEELKFAMTLCRHVKSNAIVLTQKLCSIGIGAGQMSRVDSARIAVEKARELGHSSCGAFAASDAFFPFRDSIDILAKAGVSAIVQPGGSLRDQECIDAANEHGIVMMISGQRYFRH